MAVPMNWLKVIGGEWETNGKITSKKKNKFGFITEFTFTDGTNEATMANIVSSRPTFSYVCYLGPKNDPIYLKADHWRMTCRHPTGRGGCDVNRITTNFRQLKMLDIPFASIIIDPMQGELDFFKSLKPKTFRMDLL